MDQAVLVVAAAGLGVGILFLGGGERAPVSRLLLRPGLMWLLGWLLLLVAPGPPVRWPYALVAAACATGLWEAYGGVYFLVRSARAKVTLARQLQICIIWLINTLSNLALLNVSASLAYPSTFINRNGPAAPLDVIYLTALTFSSAGYGDVVPGSPLGQVLMMLTSLAGLIYATLLLAAIYHAMRED